MRSIRLAFLLLAAMAVTYSAAAETTDYYVSPSGRDSGPGTSARPWKTLGYAFERLSLSSGDARLIVADGEYYPGETLVLNGIKDRNVGIQAAPGASPKVMGEKRLLSLKKVKGKPWLTADLKAAGIKDFGSPCDREGLVDLYWKGERQTLARYPNQGFIRAGRARGETFTFEDKNTKEGVFEYKEDRISSWADEKDPYIYGYFCFDWLDMYQRIASIDTETKTITLNEPWHGYGYATGFRYIGVNLLCELDAPGEYYIDREKGRLYWIPPEGYSAGDEATISTFSDQRVMEITDCESITIDGLTFSGGRGDALKVEASRNITLKGLNIARFGGDAINILDSKNVAIKDSRVETLGHSGIRASGGDRKTLEPAGYVVTNSVIKDFSLFKHTYQPAVFFEGCGMRIDHCEFSGSSSSALRLDASEVLVEYNYFHDLVKESDDQGVIDMWYNFAYRGVRIRYNLFENISGGSKYGAAGVRFDDMISGQNVYGNIFREVGAIAFGAVQIHGGKDNVVDNNIFYDCNAAVTFSPWTKEGWESALEREEVQNHIHKDADIESPLYRERYPELKTDIHENLNRNIIRNNLAVGCRRFFYKEVGSNYAKNNSALFTGESAENIKPLKYYLSPDVLASYGLQPIPFKEIGTRDHKPLL